MTISDTGSDALLSIPREERGVHAKLQLLKDTKTPLTLMNWVPNEYSRHSWIEGKLQGMYVLENKFEMKYSLEKGV